MTLQIIRKLNLLEKNLVQSILVFLLLHSKIFFFNSTKVAFKKPKTTKVNHSRNYTTLLMIYFFLFGIFSFLFHQARIHLFGRGHQTSFPSSFRLPNWMSYEEYPMKKFILKSLKIQAWAFFSSHFIVILRGGGEVEQFKKFTILYEMYSLWLVRCW